MENAKVEYVALQKKLQDLDKSIGTLKKELDQQHADLSNPLGHKLLSKNNITLYELYIETPHGNSDISGVTASVEDATSSQLTEARVLAAGIYDLAAKKNTGEVYLLIDSPDFSSLTEFGPKDRSQAMDLANQINNAGKQSAAILAQRTSELDEVNEKLQQFQKNEHPLQKERIELIPQVEKAKIANDEQIVEQEKQRQAVLAIRAKEKEDARINRQKDLDARVLRVLEQAYKKSYDKQMKKQSKKQVEQVETTAPSEAEAEAEKVH